MYSKIGIVYLLIGCAGSLLPHELLSSCGKKGPLSLVAVWASHSGGLSQQGLQGTQASAVEMHRFSSCGSQALEHRFSSFGAVARVLGGMWDLPGTATEPMSPTLAGRFFTAEPSQEPKVLFLFKSKPLF